jgi:hypothetical protein
LLQKPINLLHVITWLSTTLQKCQVFTFYICATWPLVQNGYLTNTFTNVNSLKQVGIDKENHPSFTPCVRGSNIKVRHILH